MENLLNKFVASVEDLLGEKSIDHALPAIGVRLHEFGFSQLDELIHELLQSEEALLKLSKRTYLHGNGFFKIPLAVTDTISIRLHIWRTGVLSEENLHSHRWPFSSTVLAGKLVSEIWEDAIGPDAVSYDELEYTSKFSDLKSRGLCQVQLKESVCHTKGDTYWLSADTLHRIVQNNHIFTATLFFHPAPTRAWARNVLLEPHRPDPKPTFLAMTKLRALLLELQHELNSPKAC